MHTSPWAPAFHPPRAVTAPTRHSGATPEWHHFPYTPARTDCGINSENIFYVTAMRFSKKRIPKQFFHVIVWITDKYMQCDFQKLIPEKSYDVTEM